MKFTIRKLGWKASCMGLALLAGSQGGSVLADDAIQAEEVEASQVVQASTANLAIVESLIEDAVQDGTISSEERRMILSQARRRLDAAGVAEVEARLATVPATPSAIENMSFSSATVSPATALADDAKIVLPQEGGVGCEEAGCAGWFDNMYWFTNTEAWRGTVDDDDSGTMNYGARVGFNLGMPLVEGRGIGLQFGMSYGGFDFHGRTGEGGANEDTSIEDHLVYTIGIFQRANLCGDNEQRCSWGIAYDRMYADNIGEEADEIYIGQWRLQFGYALSTSDEIGFWTTQGGEEEEMEDFDRDVHALHQYNFYWHRKWCTGADTRTWLGFAEDPGSFVFGADAQYPLSDCMALTASFQYILPSDDGGDRFVAGEPINSGYAREYWNFVVGVSYYPGGNAKTKSVTGRRYMPLFHVADNGSLALENTGD